MHIQVGWSIDVGKIILTSAFSANSVAAYLQYLHTIICSSSEWFGRKSKLFLMLVYIFNKVHDIFSITQDINSTTMNYFAMMGKCKRVLESFIFEYIIPAITNKLVHKKQTTFHIIIIILLCNRIYRHL